MGLSEYRQKRRFAATPEPDGADPGAAPRGAKLTLAPRPERRRFCVQQHAASHWHYDLRLEMGGVLKSWAVPKGPTLDPEVRRLAMQTEDHPLAYLNFEGEIPRGHYGAGSVVVWDIGEYEVAEQAPPWRQWEQGNLKFTLHGQRLRGAFALIQTRPRAGPGSPWLLIKKHDAFARFGDAAGQHPGSVISGLNIAAGTPGGAKTRTGKRARGAAGKAGRPGAGRRQSRGRPRRGALALPGAAPGPMPLRLQPMLATVAAQPFSSPDWLYEIKWDGVRALAYCRNGAVRLISRRGRDISRQYPELAALATAWDSGAAEPAAAVLDGEIVALDARGRSSFSRLQQRMNLAAPDEIARARERVPVVYYAFDLLYDGGAVLLQTPLEERRARLRRGLRTGRAVRFSDHVAGRGRELLALAREQQLEGIIAKRRSSAYHQGRSQDWLKFKLERRQEGVIAGYSDPHGARDYFGALGLAVYEPARRGYRYIGNVGSGFSAAVRQRILAGLGGLPGRPQAVAGLPAALHPVPLAVVAEVKFLEWTPEGKLRAPVFLGLRQDKKPRECVREGQ